MSSGVGVNEAAMKPLAEDNKRNSRRWINMDTLRVSSAKVTNHALIQVTFASPKEELDREFLRMFWNQVFLCIILSSNFPLKTSLSIKQKQKRLSREWRPEWL